MLWNNSSFYAYYNASIESVWERSCFILMIILETVIAGAVKLHRVILKSVPNILSIPFIWIRFASK